MSRLPVPRSNIDPSPFSMQRRQDAARERHRCISREAYYLAEKRGFLPGHEVEDWLAAERWFDERYE